MRLDPSVLVAILGMALATFATRAGGYFLFRAARPPQVVRDMLAYVPGGLFVSYVVPALVSGGRQQWVGAVATLVIMLVTRQLALAILGGTAAAWAIWAWY